MKGMDGFRTSERSKQRGEKRESERGWYAHLNAFGLFFEVRMKMSIALG